MGFRITFPRRPYLISGGPAPAPALICKTLAAPARPCPRRLTSTILRRHLIVAPADASSRTPHRQGLLVAETSPTQPYRHHCLVTDATTLTPPAGPASTSTPLAGSASPWMPTSPVLLPHRHHGAKTHPRGGPAAGAVPQVHLHGRPTIWAAAYLGGGLLWSISWVAAQPSVFGQYSNGDSNGVPSALPKGRGGMPLPAWTYISTSFS